MRKEYYLRHCSFSMSHRGPWHFLMELMLISVAWSLAHNALLSEILHLAYVMLLHLDSVHNSLVASQCPLLDLFLPIPGFLTLECQGFFWPLLHLTCFLGDLIHFQCLKYHLYVDDFHILISNPCPSLAFQLPVLFTFRPGCLRDMSNVNVSKSNFLTCFPNLHFLHYSLSQQWLHLVFQSKNLKSSMIPDFLSHLIFDSLASMPKTSNLPPPT